MIRTFVLLAFLSFLSACASAGSTVPAATKTLPTQAVLVLATTAPTLVPTDIPASTVAPTQAATDTTTLAPTNTSTATLTPTRAATATNTAFLPSPTRTFPPATFAPTAPPPPPVAFQLTGLVNIPQGILRMGTPQQEQGDPDEKPQHDVLVYSYAIERLEVTNAQYQACVAARACPPPTRNSSYTRPSYFGNPAFANYPVVNVTWDGANAYCKWIGRRLPNEAEWERAARGVDNWRYTFTNVLGMPFEWNAIYHGSPLSFCEASCPLQNYWGSVNDGFADTAPVGALWQDSSKGFGVQDMAGNVSEWTSNWYDPNAYTDGNDAGGPAGSTGAKVYRGGSWADEPRRNADRNSLAPNLSSDRLGFRCAQ
ncbi:MAG: formylglycine-generating enzyme family protein [Anaerolineae bacterium]